MSTDRSPEDLLRALDPNELRRHEDLVQLLAKGLLNQWMRPRPRSPFTEEVVYVGGTEAFGPLHEFVDEDQVLVLLLDRAVQELTRRELAYRISPLDRALALAGSNAVGVVLHPEEINVSRLREIPPAVRLFSINRTGDYSVRELSPFPPDRIVDNRKAESVTRRHERWVTERRELVRRLVGIVRTQLAFVWRSLPEDVLTNADDLLVRALQQGPDALDLVFEAASHLDIIPKVMAACAEQPE